MNRSGETGERSISSLQDRHHLARILVVEDHPSELGLLVDLLTGEGFDVVGCGTAAEALDHVQQEDVGVAVVDLRLPDLSGTQLLDLLRAKRQAIRVIIYTAYGCYESAREALNLGACAYLEKIGGPGELLRHVHRAVLSNMDAYAVELERVVGERNRAEKALTRAREELERRVRNRTAELDAANAALREREQQLLQALEDRDTICQDLHDGALQSLYSVGLGLETCKSYLGEDPARAREQLDHAITQLNGVMREVRYFIAGVRSDVLIAGDLQTSVERLVNGLSRSGSMQCQVRIDPEAATRLRLAERMQLAYIVQEAISNSLRHAQARGGLVRLVEGHRGVQLTIRDDGAGFDSRRVNGHGHGLKNIASRVRKIGGELRIHSEPGQGTQITVDFCGEG